MPNPNAVRRIRKAVFPVAGLGTRFLPATKTVPKEMLPIVDRPLIQYAVDEAIAAGCDTLIFITKDSEAARAFVEWLKTPIAHEVWMAQSGFLTPLKSANAETYGSDVARKMGDILLNATTFRFDGSDLMPGAVGAGTFWTGMVDYTGGKSAQEVADAIEASWPK